MNSNGDICPYCGDILPEDGSPCPSCRHLHARGLPDGADLDTVEQERALRNDSECMARGDRIDTSASKSLSGADVRYNPGNVLTEIPRNLSASISSEGVSGPDALASTRSPSANSQEMPRQKRRYVWRGPHTRHRRPRPKVKEPAPIDKNEPCSACCMCGTLYYNTITSSCSRCGGPCITRTLEEMDWMARLNPNLAYLPRL